MVLRYVLSQIFSFYLSNFNLLMYVICIKLEHKFQLSFLSCESYQKSYTVVAAIGTVFFMIIEVLMFYFYIDNFINVVSSVDTDGVLGR